MLPTAHHSANTAINIAVLGEEAREIDGQAVQIVSSSPGGRADVPRRWRQEPWSMLDELEDALRALHAVVVEASSPPARTAAPAVTRFAFPSVGIAGHLVSLSAESNPEEPSE